MKYRNICTIAIAAATFTALAAEPAITADAKLKDGSTVKGELVTKALKGSTAFSPDFSLSASIVRSLTFAGTNGEAKVVLVNDDRFTMTVANDKLSVKSILGELAIPRGSFKSLALSTKGAATASSEDGLVFHCTFDDEASITTPAVGDKGAMQRGELRPGKNGNGLYVPAYTPGASFNLPEGAFGPAGTIEFWAKIAEEGPFTTEGCPRFFVILDKNGKEGCSHDWNTNNGSGGSGLTFRLFGLTPLASPKYSIAPHSNPTIITTKDRCCSFIPRYLSPGWHHYKLVWDAQNGVSDQDRLLKHSAIVYLDGTAVAFRQLTPNWQGPTTLYNGGTLYIPNSNADYLRRAFTIDDFKIWNCAK